MKHLGWKKSEARCRWRDQEERWRRSGEVEGGFFISFRAAQAVRTGEAGFVKWSVQVCVVLSRMEVMKNESR